MKTFIEKRNEQLAAEQQKRVAKAFQLDHEQEVLSTRMTLNKWRAKCLTNSLKPPTLKSIKVPAGLKVSTSPRVFLLMWRDSTYAMHNCAVRAGRLK